MSELCYNRTVLVAIAAVYSTVGSGSFIFIVFFEDNRQLRTIATKQDVIEKTIRLKVTYFIARGNCVLCDDSGRRAEHT